MNNLINPIDNVNYATNDNHNRPHNASDWSHKASPLNNVTKSFNEIYEDLKNPNLNGGNK